jgi:hypothetical protein
MPDPNFENLSNTEIKQLYDATRAEAQKQRNLENARTGAGRDLDEQLGFTDDAGDEQHLDGFGNVVPGPKPKANPPRYYTDANGYIQELQEGQEAPQSSGYQIVDWLNRQDVANDPELRAALGPLVEESRFEVTLSDIGHVVSGTCDRRGWHIQCVSEGGHVTRFLLKGDLARDEALSQASRYIRQQNPSIHELTEEELRLVALRAANATTMAEISDAVLEYVRAAIPFQEILALDTDSYLARSDRKELLIQAVYFVWKNSSLAKGYVETEESLAYLNNYLASRHFVTVTTLIEGWDAFKQQPLTGLRDIERSYAPQPEPVPTPEDLDSLSDDEVRRLLTEAKKLRNQQRRD